MVVIGLISLIIAGSYIDVSFDFDNPPAESFSTSSPDNRRRYNRSKKINKTERVD
jgi:hypothetical protein